MAISRGQISAQIDGKLRGARGEKKKKLQFKKKPNSKKPKVFKVQSKSGTLKEVVQPQKGEEKHSQSGRYKGDLECH